jgi:hypothetical protein
LPPKIVTYKFKKSVAPCRHAFCGPPNLIQIAWVYDIDPKKQCLVFNNDEELHTRDIDETPVHVYY